MEYFVKITALKSIRAADYNCPGELKGALRRADDFTKLAVTGATMAVNAIPSEKGISADRVGIFLGTAFGPIETSFRFLDTLLDDGEGNASPTIFSHSVHNAAAGYISRILKINGPAVTFTSFTWPFLAALEQAQIAVSIGAVERAIVLGVEINSPALAYAFREIYPQYSEEDNSGAIVWILERHYQDEQLSSSFVLEKPAVTEETCSMDDLITRAREEWTGSDLHGKENISLLSHAFSLTEQLENFVPAQNENFEWSSKAPFGQAKIQLSKVF